MRLWKQGSDITRILIGYVLSDARFDWLVGNMSVHQENLFQSRSNEMLPLSIHWFACENQKALNCVVLNYSIPVSEE